MNPFVAMQAMRPARNFTFEKLKSIYKSILEIDTKLKTGKIKTTVGNQTNYLIEIEMLIIDICN